MISSTYNRPRIWYLQHTIGPEYVQLWTLFNHSFPIFAKFKFKLLQHWQPLQYSYIKYWQTFVQIMDRALHCKYKKTGKGIKSNFLIPISQQPDDINHRYFKWFKKSLYVCMFVCLYVCLYVCMFVCLYVWVFVCLYG